MYFPWYYAGSLIFTLEESPMAHTQSEQQRRRLLYFAHPINTYNTPLETRLLDRFSFWFPNADIVNPNAQKHQRRVSDIKKDDPKANVMEYFKEVAKECDGVIILPFGDGKIGAGIYAEAEVISAKGGIIWVVDTNPLSIHMEKALNPALALTVEDTRARVYLSNISRAIRPYE